MLSPVSYTHLDVYKRQGPSSSHTAGAAKLARIASLIFGQTPKKVSFGLHGSFAKTYKGHGTDKALLAGTLLLSEDDESLSHSFEIAKMQGISFEFYEENLGDVHENSVKITFFDSLDDPFYVVGSSIGGGRIHIFDINGLEADFDADMPTILISHYDQKGVVSAVSRVLAENDLNIAVMKLGRTAKGDKAYSVIETDSPIPDTIATSLRALAHVIDVRVINL